MLPGIIIQSFNEMIKTYIISQNVFGPFFYLNTFIVIIIAPGCWFFIYYMEWGILGFGVLKFLIEIVYLLWLFWILKYNKDIVKLQRESIKEVFEGFYMQVCSFCSMVLGWYGEYIGFECNTILIGLLKNNDLMAGWVAVVNIECLVWSIGFGLANTTRTLIGISIGQGDNKTAKEYAI